MVLKNSEGLIGLDINEFVTRLRQQEQVNINRAKRSAQIQDPSLYYSATPTPSPDHAPLQTAFVSNAGGASSQTQSVQNVSSSVHNQVSNASEANSSTLKTDNFGKSSVEVAKEHMNLLTTLVTSYDDLLGGRIGNSHLTHEDYEQIDRDEMERLDIMWGMANLVRRAKDYVKRTGKELTASRDTKYGFNMSAVNCYNCGEPGHFARQCEKPKRTGNENPFKGRSNRSNDSVSAGDNASGSKAMVVTQSDEGCDWSVRFGNDANVARVCELNEESASESDSVAELVSEELSDESSDDGKVAAEVENPARDEEPVESVADKNVSAEDENVAELNDEASESTTLFACMADMSTNAQVFHKTRTVCASCLKLDVVIAKLRSSNTELSHELNANLVIKGNEKLLKEKNEVLAKQVRELEVALLNKQDAVTFYINTIDTLKREKASLTVDFETLNQKLISYSKSSYLIDHMIDRRTEDNNEGLDYNNCPPPMFNKYVNSPKERDEFVIAPVVTNQNVDVEKVNDKGKSVDTSESSESIESLNEERNLGCEIDTPGIGLTSVSKPVHKTESKASKSKSSKTRSKTKPKRKPAKSSLSEPVKFVREGEWKPKVIPEISLKTPTVITGYVPPHRRTVSQESRFCKKTTQCPGKFVDCRTCFDCGNSGHVAWNCPIYSSKPHRKTSPIKSQTLFRDGQPTSEHIELATPKRVSTPTSDQQTSHYFKRSFSKNYIWRSKSEGGNSSSDSDVNATSLGFIGKWMDIQVVGFDGKPSVIRAKVLNSN